MFSRFIRAILGGLGIIRKDIKIVIKENPKADIAAFLETIEAGAVMVTRSTEPNFVQGGIQSTTQSAWQHCLLYVGMTAGEMIRKTRPQLMENSKIPKDAQYHEIIEAQGKGIIVSTLNTNKQTQIEAYIRPLDLNQLITVLERAYSIVGKPYDIAEFVGHLFPDGVIPNPKDLFVCSSAVVWEYLPVEKIVKKNIDPGRAWPKHVRNFLNSALHWRKASLFC